MDWRRWGRRLLVALAALLILLSFLPAWQTDRWWVRQWDYPRLQVAALLLLALLALFWIRIDRSRGFWALIAGALAALAWQATHFLAYLPPWPKEVPNARSCGPGRSLTLLNVNVLQTNRDYRAVLDMAARHRPDMLLLLETGPDWEKALAPLAADYPHRLAEPVPNTYGMILFSRLPMDGAILHRIQPGVPSAKVNVTLRGGEQIILHALHPEPPLPGDDSGERDAELVLVGREVRDDGRAAIVIGDMNDVAWSRTSRLFKRVGGVLDPRIGRGFYPTFTAEYPLLRWPLDHLFVTPHFAVTSIEVLGDVGSDHFPIAFGLCLQRPAGEREVARSAGPATEAEASEEVAEGKAEKREEARGQ
jgi:endonuclease/exonuclease/phosphatase (EEP) superfamily protein YafD